MGRHFRSFFLFVLVAGALLLPSRVLAEKPVAKPPLDTVLKQIEYRHYRWVAFRADVILFLVAPNNTQQGMCGGELLYNRLDERMLLSCYDSTGNLVFIFRTLDRRFDLYIPGQNTLYHGSIFDLEDSPEIDSHLKLIDLYRALKPGMFDPKRTEVDSATDVKIAVNVFGERDGRPYLSRRAYLTPVGDVVGELFFDPDGQVMTEIQRYDFQKINARVGSFKSVYFPKKVTIVSPGSGKNTAIFFNRIKPLDSIETYQFLLRIPKGTKEVFLKEVDPRFSKMALEAEQSARKESNEEKKEAPDEKVPVAEEPSAKNLLPASPDQEGSFQKADPPEAPGILPVETPVQEPQDESAADIAI